MAQTIPIEPEITRQSLHSSITEAQISEMVETFYSEISQHPRLAEIFENNMQADWNAHLDKMKTFWRSVLLRSGEYKGQPVPAHLKIDGLTDKDFGDWLSVFVPVCDRIFQPEASLIVIQTAKRIATSLWLSCSNDISAELPSWSHLNSKPTSSQKGETHEHS
jgi:hemoglobin